MILYGALEAGGTKMVCAVGTEGGGIIDQISIPTESPEETIPKLITYFKDKEIKALGIGAFGPVDLNKASYTYGYITSTPKLAWRNYDMISPFKEALGVEVGFDTDVNASALGEATWGGAKGLSDCMYMTIGTGVGVGAMTNGKLLHGMMHPEAGHITLMRHSEDRNFEANCPYHQNCFEGLAAGPALEKRWGKKAYELGEKRAVWELEAYYIGQALVNYIMTLSPQRIILGGGVMHQEQLLPLIHKEVKRQLGGYILTKELEQIEDYIILATLQDQQGIMGCIKLAMDTQL